MKTSYNSRKLTTILLSLLLMGLFAACKQEEPKPRIDYLKLYKEPNYPKKTGGRFLKSIAYQYPVDSLTPNPELVDGIKVEFFYNKKNYVNYYKIYGTGADHVGRQVRIEYNLTGLVSRIKYFDPDSTITSFELFEYNTLKKLSRISRYDLADDRVNYALASYNLFTYPNLETIQELRYVKIRQFDRPFRDIYAYDTIANIRDKVDYEYDTKVPYASTEFIYNAKKRPFENLGLPVYETTYDDFQLSEIFSKDHLIGFQAYTYEDSVKVKSGEAQSYEDVYDDLGYPVSRNGKIFYNYIDLE
ncbi:MAG TPA: hypothetical protein VGK10_15060 [Prolixibacteraceae bacterium]|jgi:hypothetical protein